MNAVVSPFPIIPWLAEVIQEITRCYYTGPGILRAPSVLLQLYLPNAFQGTQSIISDIQLLS